MRSRPLSFLSLCFAFTCTLVTTHAAPQGLFKTAATALILWSTSLKINRATPLSWITTLDSPRSDQAHGMAFSNDSNIFLTGQTTSFGNGNPSLFIGQYTTAQKIQRMDIFSGSRSDIGRDLTVDNNGDVYVIGDTSSTGNGVTDILLVKLSDARDEIWAKVLGGNSADKGFDIAPSHGGFLIAGEIYYEESAYDALIAYINTEGDVIWANTLGGSSVDSAQSIAITPDGGFVVGEYTRSYGVGNYDFLLAKFSSTRQFEWGKTFGGMDEDKGLAVVVTPDGGFALTGYTWNSNGFGLTDCLLIKLDEKGDLQWGKLLGGNNYEECSALSITEDGKIVVAGYTSSEGVGGDELLLALFEVEGSVDWIKSLGGSGNERAEDIYASSDGHIFCTGWSESYGESSLDILLTKFRQDSLDDCAVLADMSDIGVLDVTDDILWGDMVPTIMPRNLTSHDALALLQVETIFLNETTVCEMTFSPTKAPTQSPTKAPSESPSIAPTAYPTLAPSMSPSSSATTPPSIAPSVAPTDDPTKAPTQSPTKIPSVSPSSSPTIPPSIAPDNQPYTDRSEDLVNEVIGGVVTTAILFVIGCVVVCIRQNLYNFFEPHCCDCCKQGSCFCNFFMYKEQQSSDTRTLQRSSAQENKLTSNVTYNVINFIVSDKDMQEHMQEHRQLELRQLTMGTDIT